MADHANLVTIVVSGESSGFNGDLDTVDSIRLP
jgi:hypothetical protein